MGILKLAGIILLATIVVLTGCANDSTTTSPESDSLLANKNGTETLGAPDISIAQGSGFVEAGVGMVGVESGSMTVSVPDSATIEQVLVYWAGGTTGLAGDDRISINGQMVYGTLIGGPIDFFSFEGKTVSFSAYRADVTDLNLIAAGENVLTVSDFDFPITGIDLDENNGCSVVVIYGDGRDAELSVVDGIDMAFFDFGPTLDATAPQTFSVTPANEERVADLLLVVGSVGADRPNQVLVTTSAGVADYANVLGSLDGDLWDSLIISITIPAGDDEVTVQLVSTPTNNPLGASLGWICAALAVANNEPVLIDISGTVYLDSDSDASQSGFESGIGNVVIDVTDTAGAVTLVTTDENGHYLFNGPAGSYTIEVNLVDHSESFNDDLASSFEVTTPIQVSVSGQTANIDFGFVPSPEAILADLEMEDLITDAESLRYWKKVFRKAIISERSCRRGRHSPFCGHVHGARRHGHENHRCHGGCPGWGHNESYPTPDELREFLTEIAGLYQPEPYTFTEGLELWEAFKLLRTRPDTDEGLLFRELFVTELNFVSQLGLVGEADRVAVLISWGESLLVTPIGKDNFNKAGAPNFRGAYLVFDAINTGGGGGVDE